ncbi:MAG: LPS-assembly protein LptD, partial [Candidatus Obscuribacterales bacterium]|nr:LPS-assembly protein LptD [Steroidobacteraceae bacterium]
MNLCRARYSAYCALVAFLPLCTTAQECPNPQVAPQTRAVRAPPTAALNGIDGFTDIDASANQTELRANGDITLEGDVEVKQGERVLRAPRIDYSAAEGSLRIPGAVELSDPQLRLKGEQASVAAEGTAEFFNTEFELKARAGHGSAERIRVSSGGELTLSDVRYTTCPGPKPDWELKVGSLKIDEQTRVGTATNARVEIKGVPIFYTPYISFPVGNERKSGFLFPASASSRGGPGLSVPWYWNIAPNYDATFAPTWYSGRGAELGLELRGLTQRHRGVLNGSYLPDDQRTDSDRSFVELQTQSNFTRSLRLTTDGANVGDVDHFEDFGGSGQFSSITVLPRAVQLEYLGDEWLLGARAQNYQIIDRQIPLDDRPYTLLPQVYLQGYFPDRVYGITAAINGEYSAFTRSHAGVQQAAQRLDVAPELRLPLRGPSAFLEPAVGWRYTTYRLNEAWSTGSNGTERSPTRSLPIFSVDSGVVFERSSGRTGQRVQTLEPR